MRSSAVAVCLAALAACSNGRQSCPQDAFVDVTGACIGGCVEDGQCSGGQICDGELHECVCRSGFASCSGSCVPESVDHCGPACLTCTAPPGAVASCHAGRCDFACPAGAHLCTGTCVAESPSSCGPSCSSCPAGPNEEPTCESGACGKRCAPGFLRCGGACVREDADHCGIACEACQASPGSVAICSQGACGTACPLGENLCDASCAPDSDLRCGPSCGSCIAGTHCSQGKCVAACPQAGTLADAIPISPNIDGSGAPVGAADFDGDGIADLVLGDFTDLLVFPGSETGVLRAPQVISGCGSGFFQFGDVNHDGNLDIVVAGSDICTLLGDGAGGFAVPVHTPIPVSQVVAMRLVHLSPRDPASVVLWVVQQGNPGATALQVFAGAGDGSFVAPAGNVDAPPTNVGLPMLAGDFNGDGADDLLFVDPSLSAVQLMSGDGAGGFAAPTRLGLTTQSFNIPSLAIADVNGDGFADVVIGHDAIVEVKLGSASAPLANGLETPVPVPIASIAAGDLDGDGRSDVIVTSLLEERFTILLGAADGRLVAGDRPRVGVLARSPLVLADFDGDGRLDAGGFPQGRFEFAIARSAPGGTFRAPLDIPIGERTSVTGVAVADFDGDGLPDFAVATLTGVRSFRNLGGGQFVLAATVDYADGAFNVLAGDFDRDGKVDLVTSSGTAIDFLHGNGDGTFAPPVRVATPNSRFGSVAAADLDGDGRLDLALVEIWNDLSSHVEIMLGDGAGSFGPRTHVFVVQAFTGISFGPLLASDVTQDGIPDLIVGIGSGPSTVPGGLLIIPSAGPALYGKPVIFGPMSAVYSIAVADLDGTGPVVIANQDDGNSLRVGFDGGAFTAAASLPPLGVFALADLDGTHAPDLVSGDVFGFPMHLFRNDGSGAFAQAFDFETNGHQSSAVADFDGDGKPDLLVAGGGSITLFRGACR